MNLQRDAIDQIQKKLGDASKHETGYQTTGTFDLSQLAQSQGRQAGQGNVNPQSGKGQGQPMGQGQKGRTINFTAKVVERGGRKEWDIREAA